MWLAQRRLHIQPYVFHVVVSVKLRSCDVNVRLSLARSQSRNSFLIVARDVVRRQLHVVSHRRQSISASFQGLEPTTPRLRARDRGTKSWHHQNENLSAIYTYINNSPNTSTHTHTPRRKNITTNINAQCICNEGVFTIYIYFYMM